MSLDDFYFPKAVVGTLAAGRRAYFESMGLWLPCLVLKVGEESVTVELQRSADGFTKGEVLERPRGFVAPKENIDAHHRQVGHYETIVG